LAENHPDAELEIVAMEKNNINTGGGNYNGVLKVTINFNLVVRNSNFEMSISFVPTRGEAFFIFSWF